MIVIIVRVVFQRFQTIQMCGSQQVITTYQAGLYDQLVHQDHMLSGPQLESFEETEVRSMSILQFPMTSQLIPHLVLQSEPEVALAPPSSLQKD